MVFLSWSKVIALTLIVGRYLHWIVDDDEWRWMHYCEVDYEFCEECFRGNNDRSTYPFYTTNCCALLLENVELSTNIESTINIMFGNRVLQFGTIHDDMPIVLKYLANTERFNEIKSLVCDFVKNESSNEHCDILWQNVKKNSHLLQLALRHVYETSARVDGIKQCPRRASTNFINTFNRFETETLFWIHLLLNPELVLLKTLHSRWAGGRFAHTVPTLYEWCGFVLTESNAGIPLYEYYANSFRDRIFLAKQLLEAAIEFTHGVNGLRYLHTTLNDDHCLLLLSVCVCCLSFYCYNLMAYH